MDYDFLKLLGFCIGAGFSLPFGIQEIRKYYKVNCSMVWSFFLFFLSLCGIVASFLEKYS